MANWQFKLQWRSLKDAEHHQKVDVNQHTGRDTNRDFGALQVNGLQSGLGHSPGDPPKENAGAALTATDVQQDTKATNFRGQSTPKWGANSTHNRAGRVVEYALTISNSDAWHAASFVFGVRLTEAERAALAYAALNSLDHDTAYMTASAVLFRTLGGEVLS